MHVLVCEDVYIFKALIISRSEDYENIFSLYFTVFSKFYLISLCNF